MALKDIPDGEKRFEDMFGDMADSLFVEHILPIYHDVNYVGLDQMILDNAMNGRGNVEQKEVHKVCHRPFYRLRVTANGEVMANCCDQPHDIRYGNIMEQGLVDLWNGKVRTAFLKCNWKEEDSNILYAKTAYWLMISQMRLIYWIHGPRKYCTDSDFAKKGVKVSTTITGGMIGVMDAMPEKINVLQFPIGNTKGGVTHYALNNWKFIDKSKFHFDFATMSHYLSIEQEIKATGAVCITSRNMRSRILKNSMMSFAIF